MDLKELLAKITEPLSRAYEAAYEKDGSLIIPVTLVAGGGGGGVTDVRGAKGARPLGADDDMDDPEDEFHPSEGESRPPPPGESGGGSGDGVMPVGVYIVKDDDVR